MFASGSPTNCNNNLPSEDPSPLPPDFMKAYIGCKIIRATPIKHDDFLKEQDKYRENQETLGDGYKVFYPDGYISFSPKKVFEEAYREISLQERSLIF